MGGEEFWTGHNLLNMLNILGLATWVNEENRAGAPVHA